jgi:hypothetical protein
LNLVQLTAGTPAPKADVNLVDANELRRELERQLEGEIRFDHPVINLKTEDGIRKFASIAEQVADLVVEYGGALSAEHGDGMVRSPFMRKLFGDVLYEAFREVKRTFDPLGILNPGKIVDSPPLTANLRLGTGYRRVILEI